MYQNDENASREHPKTSSSGCGLGAVGNVGMGQEPKKKNIQITILTRVL